MLASLAPVHAEDTPRTIPKGAAQVAWHIGIHGRYNDPETSVLRLERTPGEVEWVVFNPGEVSVEVAGTQTRKAHEYRQ